jgi:hypothetical protein
MFYRVKKNGFVFCEMIPEGKIGWRAYKVWHGDLWECPNCEHQLIEGVGKEPVAEHFDEEFADEMKNVEGCVYSN